MIPETGKRITQEEMTELFGNSMPMEAVNLLFNSPGDKTVGEIRDKLRAIATKKHDIVRSMSSSQRVPFRLIQTPCCSTLLCWVNPRFPSHCPECGTFIFATVKGCVLVSDDNAWLKTKT
jgi:hypothetical protein